MDLVAHRDVAEDAGRDFLEDGVALRIVREPDRSHPPAALEARPFDHAHDGIEVAALMCGEDWRPATGKATHADMLGVEGELLPKPFEEAAQDTRAGRPHQVDRAALGV
jgi:hypothetical protein